MQFTVLRCFEPFLRAALVCFVRKQWLVLTIFLFNLSVSASAQVSTRLGATDGAENDRLGGAVAIDKDMMVTGSPYADVDGNADQGAAYVFTRSNGAWTQTAKLTASDGTLFIDWSARGYHFQHLSFEIRIVLSTLFAACFLGHGFANLSNSTVWIWGTISHSQWRREKNVFVK